MINIDKEVLYQNVFFIKYYTKKEKLVIFNNL